MTVFWLIAAFVLGFSLYVLWLRQRRLREQANHDASAVRSDLQMLPKRGYNDGVLWFEDIPLKGSLHFRKYISETGDFGVMIEIPRTFLSNDEYAELI
jgi:hypothetical protein